MRQATEKKAAKQGSCTITRKTPTDWAALLGKAEEDHWRVLKIVIQMNERLYAGKPKQLDAAEAMIRARKLGDVLEAKAESLTDPKDREAKAEEVKDEGLTEFYRRPGKPGLWVPSHQFKAMFKEAWGALGYFKDARPTTSRGPIPQPASDLAGNEDSEADGEESASDKPKKEKALQGSRGAIAECVFAFGTEEREWIKVSEKDAPDGIETNPTHTMGPTGPCNGIKRMEYIERPRLTFFLKIARAQLAKLPDETIADVLVHAQKLGFGGNRSREMSGFTVVSVEDVA